jgi:hypothetical protein
MLGYADFRWKGDKLILGTRNTGCKIIPDATWPMMFRVEYPPGTISDMTNLTRAKDAAISIVAHHLNRTTEKEVREPAGVVFPSSGHPHSQQVQITAPSSLAA